MFDNAQDNSRHPLVLWVGRRPHVALGIGLAGGALLVALLLSTVHHRGVPMVTPGRKPTPFTQAALEQLSPAFQALRSSAQASAATLQADARA